MSKTHKPLNPSTLDPLNPPPLEPLKEGWRWVRLGEVCEVKGGKRLPRGYEFAKEKTLYPYIRVVDMQGGLINIQGLRYLTSEVRSMISKYTISADDVYISIAGTIGLVGTIPPELDRANLTENAAKLVIKDQTILNRDYLWLFLNSDIGQQFIRERINLVGQPKLALFRIKSIPTLLPSLPEQKRIATKIQELIQEVERARTACEKELEAAKALPAAYLREVYESEEAKKWERKRLGEVCEIIMGQSPPSNSYNKQKTGLPFFQGKADFGAYFPVAKVWCSNPLKISQANDVLISVRAPVGPVNMADQKCCIGRGLTALRGKGSIDSWFIFFYFKNIENNWKGRGSTFDAIRKKDLEEITISFPPILEQTRIATYLKEKFARTENTLSTIQNQQSALDALPQAILQKAFRGELSGGNETCL